MKRPKASQFEKAIAKKAGISKYRAIPTVIDGIRFDSRAEAFRYSELCLLQKAGKIKDLKVHPVFELLPKAIVNGVKLRAVKYEADFSYTEIDSPVAKDFRPRDVFVVEDVKGMETPVFRLKLNLFLRTFPSIDMRIVHP